MSTPLDRNKSLVLHQLSPLNMLRTRIAQQIAIHQAEIMRLRQRETVASRWDLEDQIWQVMDGM